MFSNNILPKPGLIVKAKFNIGVISKNIQQDNVNIIKRRIVEYFQKKVIPEFKKAYKNKIKISVRLDKTKNNKDKNNKKKYFKVALSTCTVLEMIPSIINTLNIPYCFDKDFNVDIGDSTESFWVDINEQQYTFSPCCETTDKSKFLKLINNDISLVFYSGWAQLPNYMIRMITFMVYRQSNNQQENAQMPITFMDVECKDSNNHWQGQVVSITPQDPYLIIASKNIVNFR